MLYGTKSVASPPADACQGHDAHREPQPNRYRGPLSDLSVPPALRAIADRIAATTTIADETPNVISADELNRALVSSALQLNTRDYSDIASLQQIMGVKHVQALVIDPAKSTVAANRATPAPAKVNEATRKLINHVGALLASDPNDLATRVSPARPRLLTTRGITDRQEAMLRGPLAASASSSVQRAEELQTLLGGQPPVQAGANERAATLITTANDTEMAILVARVGGARLNELASDLPAAENAAVNAAIRRSFDSMPLQLAHQLAPFANSEVYARVSRALMSANADKANDARDLMGVLVDAGFPPASGYRAP